MTFEDARGKTPCGNGTRRRETCHATADHRDVDAFHMRHYDTILTPPGIDDLAL
jgi:hypothetical protein